MSATAPAPTIVLTRALEDSGPLRTALEERGATVVPFPCIRIEAIDGDETRRGVAGLDADAVAWIVFASRNGVRYFGRLLDRVGSSLPAGIRLAAVGPGTADAVRDLGREPDLVASVSTAEGLLEALLKSAIPDEGEIVLPAAERGREVLVVGLREAGYSVRRIPVYRTVSIEEGPSLPGPVDAIVFTSPSTVRGFFDRAPFPAGARAISIGPSTSRALRERGVPPVEAVTHDLPGLIEATMKGTERNESR